MSRKEIIAFLRKAGSNGGKARAKSTTHEQRSEWSALGAKERERRKRQRERDKQRGTKREAGEAEAQEEPGLGIRR